jgi:hypothetical protein
MERRFRMLCAVGSSLHTFRSRSLVLDGFHALLEVLCGGGLVTVIAVRRADAI